MFTFDLDLALREATALYTKEQIFVLMDENTKCFCLPEIEKTLTLIPSHCLALPAGENKKSLETVSLIWDWLIQEKATRYSLLLILGGGVLCDMGGFAAATYMRGIPFVNIPTTLLSAVDAGEGGKTGVNYKGLKNYVGLFAKPAVSIVYPPFLQTLPTREILSGFAEMLKHALIASPLELAQILAFEPHSIGEITEESTFAELLRRSMEIKNYVVEQDPEEKDLRKTLNFGHTVGHALEEYSLQTATTLDSRLQTSDSMLSATTLDSRLQTSDFRLLSHGEAVAHGIVAELYLSFMKLGFDKEVLRKVTHFIGENYGKITCPCKDYDVLIELMKHDKKGVQGEINCTLLAMVGNCRINQTISEEEMKEALDFLFNQ